MCGRFVLVSPADVIADVFKVEVQSLSPRYNIAPSQHTLSIRNDGVGVRQAVALKWGLIPTWAKDAKIGSKLINARSETVAEKPSFRQAYKRRRCLIPANGFYEWRREGTSRFPRLFRMADFGVFGLAGLWERWSKSSAGPIETFTILTTSANRLVSSCHNRMPVIVEPDGFDAWLDSETPQPVLEAILKPFPEEEMVGYQVSQIVNSPKNDLPECIVPV